MSGSEADFEVVPAGEAGADMTITLGGSELKENAAVVESVAKLTAAAADEERLGAANELAAVVKSADTALLQLALDKLVAAADNAKDVNARLGALAGVSSLSKALGRAAEPYLLKALPKVLELSADKVAAVRGAADACSQAFVAGANPLATKQVVDVLLSVLDINHKWQTRAAGLNLLKLLTTTAPAQLGRCLPEIVPAVSPCMVDSREQVKEGGISTMTACFGVVGNRDIEGTIPALISCICRPAEVPDCIHKLGATTFVQAVETPCLAILVPLLLRGLVERQTAIKRKTAVIIDNMAKLVDNPADAYVFLPRLLPGLEKVADEVADPECRQVALKAINTLKRIGGDSSAAKLAAALTIDLDVTLATLKETCKETFAKDHGLGPDAETSLKFATAVAAYLVSVKDFSEENWLGGIAPYLDFLSSADEAAAASKSLLAKLYQDVQNKTKVEEEEDEGEDLCNCEFSLAYGGKILLNNATLRLKKGRRYGLCGPNGAGKSTLMRAIANGQVEGFPPKTELRTVYVEHDIDACHAEMSSVDFVFADEELQSVKACSKEVITEMLSRVGFTDELRNKNVGALSGGWKMKLALARAMLMEPQIMLLDEPTNHLDVTNVAWLENHLVNLDDVSIMVVSHDSGFLDNVCTDILHYEGRKLRSYRGNLSKFVERVPEAKAYYTLEAPSMTFKFPEPGYLEGIKTKDRAVLKMAKVGYKYPNTDRTIFSGASLAVTLSSRVAVVGANGAGKSTLIKVLTGEAEPTEGDVWKHPNLRIAYVAQHAFHHLEKHLDKTPNQYIQWRYAIGEDREAMEKETRQISEEEEKAMQQKIMHDGQKKVLEKILGRRKLKKTYEYEVQWVGLGPDQNSWLPRDVLEELGFTKLLNEVDVKEAARSGLAFRPLTAANIQKHLEDVGLEAEFGTHSHIRGLSGGQKVKVVIAAAMWNQPHLLVLDEPTNYLDRDSLGALAAAIKEYGGGVIMITHHTEFSSALCPETWVVADGKVDCKGGNWLQDTAEKAKLEWKAQEETVDAFGNVIKIKAPKKKLSNKEKKAAEKLRKARKERGEEVTDSEEEY